MTLVAPHGGVLVDRFVAPARIDAVIAEAAALPSVTLDARELADLELIATGAASPLTGFLGPADHARVLAEGRLASGVAWPVPLVLAVDDAVRPAVAAAGAAALRDGAGRLWGVIRDVELWQRDPIAEVRALFGTDDVNHPGVQHLLSRPRWLAGGPVEVLPLPDTRPLAARRLAPRAVRAELEARGWRHVAALATARVLDRGDEHLVRVALETTDGVVVLAAADGAPGDVPADVRFAAHDAVLARRLPAARTLLVATPGGPRFAGAREAALDVLVAKNHGLDRAIVTVDVDTAALDAAPLRLAPAFWCRACDATATARTCPHDAGERVVASTARVRDLLRTGRHVPRELLRPEVAALLRAHHGGAVDVASAPAAAAPAARGFIVWFTGLSGAGKSTLSAALRARLAPQRELEILDGDEVRTHLSKGLGFSREDRDVNVHRIGFVARTLARHGVGVVTAAISPYADTRRQVRELAEARGVPFVEVHVKAELAALVQRDVKGLYKKALAGEVPHFSGISDPYEPPEHPDVVVRTDQETVDQSLDQIVAALVARGLVAPPTATLAAAGAGSTQVHARAAEVRS